VRERTQRGLALFEDELGLGGIRDSFSFSDHLLPGTWASIVNRFTVGASIFRFACRAMAKDRSDREGD
jgi:hypothetical protein